MNKVECHSCSALILQETAVKYDGLCARCSPAFSKKKSGTSELAARWKRLVAQLIDCLVSILIMVPIFLFTDYWDIALAAARQQTSLPLSYTLLITFYSFGVFFAINWKFLAEDGQTLGKRAMRISIRDMEGNTILMSRMLLLRMFPYYGVYYLPFIGGLLSLINVLFIFGKNRRCLHDRIAGTKVMNVDANKSKHTDGENAAGV